VSTDYSFYLCENWKSARHCVTDVTCDGSSASSWLHVVLDNPTDHSTTRMHSADYSVALAIFVNHSRETLLWWWWWRCSLCHCQHVCPSVCCSLIMCQSGEYVKATLQSVLVSECTTPRQYYSGITPSGASNKVGWVSQHFQIGLIVSYIWQMVQITVIVAIAHE